MTDDDFRPMPPPVSVYFPALDSPSSKDYLSNYVPELYELEYEQKLLFAVENYLLPLSRLESLSETALEYEYKTYHEDSLDCDFGFVAGIYSLNITGKKA